MPNVKSCPCGEKFIITDLEFAQILKLLGFSAEPTHCRNCRKNAEHIATRTAEIANSQVVSTKDCRECGGNFTVTIAELDRLQQQATDNNWEFVREPTKCVACRAKTRHNRRLDLATRDNAIW